MARRLTLPLPIAALATLGLVAAGCGRETDRIDATSVVDAIPLAIAPEAPDLVRDVSCPEEIERGPGVTLECRLTLSGTPLVATVEQLDDEGRISVRTDTVVLDTHDLARDLGHRLEEDLGVVVGVDCDAPRLFVPEAGTELVCDARDEAARPIRFSVTLLDAEGAYEVRATG